MKIYIIHTYKGNGFEVGGSKDYTHTLILRDKDFAERMAADMEKRFQAQELSKDWTVAVEECEI